jgi:hypothetical protein
MMRPVLFLLLLATPCLPARGVYGPAVQADSLANTTLGPGGNEVSCRFRARPGGRLLAIRPFLIWSFRKAGYHGGTGGILQVDIRDDDGSPEHRPAGSVLASSVQRLYLVPGSDQFFPRITFDRAPLLRPGRLYHAVFSNRHPQAQFNFLSINALFSREADAPAQPGRADEDWAMLLRNQRHPDWAPRRTPGTREAFTPILEVTYDRGAQGLGYVEAWMGAPRSVGGACQVAERFTVPVPGRTVRGVAARVRRLRGRTPLVLRLETLDGGKVAEVACPAETLAPTPSAALGGCGWVTAAWPVPLRLRGGTAYRLVLAAAEAGAFEAFPLRKGADKGFAATTWFGDGNAEFKTGRAWEGWSQWGQYGRRDSDLQFYFVLE